MLGYSKKYHDGVEHFLNYERDGNGKILVNDTV